MGNNSIGSEMFAGRNQAVDEEEILIKQGLLPPNFQPNQDHLSQSYHHHSPSADEPPYDASMEQPYEPMEHVDYGNGFPPPPVSATQQNASGNGLLGALPPSFSQRSRGGNQHWRSGGGAPRFRGNSSRGYERGSSSLRDHHNSHHHRRGGPPGRGGAKDFPIRRPCKFFKDRGYCRDGDQCRFQHSRH